MGGRNMVERGQCTEEEPTKPETSGNHWSSPFSNQKSTLHFFFFKASFSLLLVWICFPLFNYRKLLDHHSVTDVAQVPKQSCLAFALYLPLHDFSISCSCSCCLCHSVFSSLHKLPKLVTFENRCRNAGLNFLLTHRDMQGLKSREATHETCLASC